MKLLGKVLTLFFKLPDSLKYKLAGGKALVIRGNTLDIDNQLLALNSAKGPQLDNMPPQKARALFRRMTLMINGELDKDIQISALNIPPQDTSSSHSIPARLYTPKALISDASPQSSALLIYYHGGGMVIGDLDSYDVLCADFAAQLNIRVLSVDYRLAPEHKFPAGSDDAYSAYRWAQQHAETLNIDASQILLAGDSAGGYLSSAVSLQAIENRIDLPKAQILIYPMCDLSVERESLELFAENLVLTKNMMDYFITHYINDETDKLNPLCSNLLASDESLKQMPPTLISVAGFDPLHDEGIDYYKKLKKLGVDIQLLEHNDLTHGFITMTGVLKRGNEAKDEIIQLAKAFLQTS